MKNKIMRKMYKNENVQVRFNSNEKCTNQETSNDSNNSLLNNLKIANYQNII